MAAACSNNAEARRLFTCPIDYDKRSLCCGCVTYHCGKGQMLGCFFSREGEATWSRSVQNLFKECGVS